MSAVTPNAAADYILASQNYEEGDSITHLKLQKLVYYCQAWHLVLLDRPLFDEDIQAWIYGPVVPSLYKRFKDKGCQAIPHEDIKTEPVKIIPKESRDVMDQVLNVFMGMTATQLSKLTHDEDPWKNVYDPDDFGHRGIITKESMKDYYTQVMNADG